MEEETANNKIIVALVQHLVLGPLLIPYVTEEGPEETIYLQEQAFHASSEVPEKLPPIEREIIEIASRYTEKKLMAAYSREKTVAAFLKKVSENTLRKTIWPFIERKMEQIIDLICTHNIPLYQNQAGNKIVYPHSRIDVSPYYTEAYFHFEADEQTFSYTLTCTRNGEDISLREKKPVLVLTHEPATLLLNTELHRFKNIQASRILPFTNKREVSVDVSLMQKYMENIVFPIVQYHEVSANNLPLYQEERICQPILTVEETIFDGLALKLEFQYGDHFFRAIPFRPKYAYLKKEKDQTSVHYYYRNQEEETRIRQLLEDRGLTAKGECTFALRKDAPEKDLAEWMMAHKELLTDHFKLTNSQRNIEYSLEDIVVQKNIQETQDWFELHINVRIGEFNFPFIRFRKNILEGRRDFLLPNGRLVLLPEEWFSKFGDLFLFGESDEKEIRIKRAFSGIVQAAFEKKQGKIYQPKEETPPPAQLKATLRSYQKDGFNWMLHLYKHRLGGCLADDMGLGKTLQTLTLLQYLYSQTEEKRNASLIVMPTSLIHNWKREVKKFTTLKAYEYCANSLPSNLYMKSAFDNHHIVLTSYGMMRNNIDALEKYPFDYVVLDESQHIKNSESQTFKSALRLQSNFRLVLTGTPIENSLRDLWSQFYFIQPGLLGTEGEFSKNYITPVKQGDQRIESRLQKLISPYILRRSKEEVAPELPSLTEEIIFCSMSSEQKKIYLQEKNGLRNVLLQMSLSPVRHNNLTALNGIMRLRQLASHPQMVLDDYTGSSEKLEDILAIFETLRSEGHKVLIFSSFVKHLNLIAQALEERNWKYALLTGSTVHREEEIARFNAHKDIQAFLISLKAGGVGLNLTQADYVFIVDPWWNPAAEMQAISRAHRIGQDKHVMAYRFITEDSIEEKILQLQEEKRKLSETFITESNPFEALTDQEWAKLLEE